MSEQPTKTKKPKRSQAEMAVVHAQRADSARRKSVEATGEYKIIAAAVAGLEAVQQGEFSVSEWGAIRSALQALDDRAHSLLSPKQGVSAT